MRKGGAHLYEIITVTRCNVVQYLVPGMDLNIYVLNVRGCIHVHVSAYGTHLTYLRTCLCVCNIIRGTLLHLRYIPGKQTTVVLVLVLMQNMTLTIYRSMLMSYIYHM